jgi:hypothetical protein
MTNGLQIWHKLLQERNANALNEALADTVVLHSPVVHTPIEGKKMVRLYLTAALHTFANDSFQYVREFHTAGAAVLEFTTEVDGIFVNGVDMITWDAEGKITDFKVMVRPLKAVNMIHKKMGEMLEKLK